MKAVLHLLIAAVTATSLQAQLAEERICPQSACFVSDRGKIIEIESPLTAYSDKQWLGIHYETAERPRLTIAVAAVQNMRTISGSTSTYDGEEEATSTFDEAVIPLGGLEDFLVEALRNTKLFDVVERIALQEVQEERELTYDLIGSLTAGQYVAVASVNEFSETSRAKTRGIKSKLGRLGLGRNTRKVGVSLRIVAVGSGRVVFSTFETAAISSWRGEVRGDDEDEETEVSTDSLLSRAIVSSLNKAAFKVARWAVDTPWWSVVIKVDSDEQNTFVYLAGGRQQGVQSGMHLVVWSQGEELVHPVTGEVLGQNRIRMGTALVNDVREQFSIAKMVSGNPGIAIGDRVELVVREKA